MAYETPAVVSVRVYPNERQRLADIAKELEITRHGLIRGILRQWLASQDECDRATESIEKTPA